MNEDLQRAIVCPYREASPVDSRTLSHLIDLLDIDDDTKESLIKAIAQLRQSETSTADSCQAPSFLSGAFDGSSSSSSSIFSLLAGSCRPTRTLTPQSSADIAASMTLALVSTSSDSGDLSPQLLSLLSSYRSQLEDLRPLGKGGQGSVTLMRSKLDGRLIAVKRISFRSKCPPWEPFEKMEASHSRMLREVRALAALDFSPHVIKYYSSWIEPDWKRISTTYKQQRAQSSLPSSPVTDRQLMLEHQVRDDFSGSLDDMTGASSSHPSDDEASSTSSSDEEISDATTLSGDTATKNSAFTFDRNSNGSSYIQPMSIDPDSATITKSRSCVIHSVEDADDESSLMDGSLLSRSESASEGTISISGMHGAICLAPNHRRNNRLGAPMDGNDRSSHSHPTLKKQSGSLVAIGAHSEPQIKWPYLLHIAMEPIVHGLTLDAWLKRRIDRRKASPLLLPAPQSSLISSSSPSTLHSHSFCLGAVEKEIFRQIAVGLAHVHAANILHRDLKPSNIFIIPSPPAEINVKLIDFGLSTLTSPLHSSSSSSTQSTTSSSFKNESSSEDGSSPPHPHPPPSPSSSSSLSNDPNPPLSSIPSQATNLPHDSPPAPASLSEDSSNHTIKIGTPSYAAPEQLRGKGRYGPSVDMFPLGLILIELCIPFGTAMEKAVALGNARGGVLGSSNSGVVLPQGMDEGLPHESKLIRRLLSHDPRLRPTTWELCETLGRIWGGPGGGPEEGGGVVIDDYREGSVTSGSSLAGDADSLTQRRGGESAESSVSSSNPLPPHPHPHPHLHPQPSLYSQTSGTPAYCIVEEGEGEAEGSFDGGAMYLGKWRSSQELLSLLIMRDEEIERLKSQ